MNSPFSHSHLGPVPAQTGDVLADLVGRRRSFTARSIDRLIKVARTIADLLGQDDIDAGCLLEAAGVRDVDPLADLAS